MADSNGNLGAVLGPVTQAMQGQQQSFGGGMDQGIKLAQTAQDLQLKKQQQQENQQKLQDMQFKSYTGTLGSALGMSDEVFKASEKLLDGRLSQMVPGYQPGGLKVLRDNPEMRVGSQTFLNALATGEVPLTPELQQQTLHAATDLGMQEQLLTSWNEQRKMKAAQALAQVKGGYQVEAAKQRGAPLIARTQAQQNDKYTANMKDPENAIYSANRALGVMDKIDLGDLKSTKTLSADLNSAVASLLGGGKPSTVYGQEAAHADDLYERVKHGTQFITSEPQDTQSPAKLKQLKLDVQALKDFYDEQHAQRYSSWRQGVPEQLREGVDRRYKQFRKNQGMDEAIAGEEGAQQTAPAQPSQQPQQAAPSASQAHPQDQQAIEWGKANMNSPDHDTAIKARNILKVNGVQ